MYSNAMAVRRNHQNSIMFKISDQLLLLDFHEHSGSIRTKHLVGNRDQLLNFIQIPFRFKIKMIEIYSFLVSLL